MTGKPPAHHCRSSPSRHPFGPALTGLRKRPPTHSVKRARNRETPMPRLGSMPDPKEKPRTLLIGWMPGATGLSPYVVKFIAMACQFGWGYPLCKYVIFR